MAIIIADADARPALLVRNDIVDIPKAGHWRDTLLERNVLIQRSAYGVGRVEIATGVSPMLATAFIVSPQLAVTASHVGEALINQRDTAADGLLRASINFGAQHAGEDVRVDIAAVEPVHPYWRFAFLRLTEPVDKNRILPISERIEPGAMKDREIALIGYPVMDVRNAPADQSAVFAGVYGVKRVMLGVIRELQRESIEAPLMLMHDATTMGGSSGAPLIDLESGHVVGIHFSGRPLVGNFAAPAWELSGDPQWARVWEGEATRPASAPVKPRRIFEFDEIQAIYDLLAQLATSDSALASLFSGLPPEFLGTLPSGESVADRLDRALHYINDFNLEIEARPPFYYVLMNAKRRQRYNVEFVKAMEFFIAKVDAGD